MKTKNKYYNPNPKKIETSDCVVRALCKATEQDWDNVYKTLCDIGFKNKVLPNDDVAWKEFLINNGFHYQKITNKRGSTRPTVDSFVRKHKKGIYVLRVANHIVTCVDGYYYDIWDCGDRSLYGYWEKEIK